MRTKQKHKIKKLSLDEYVNYLSEISNVESVEDAIKKD